MMNRRWTGVVSAVLAVGLWATTADARATGGPGGNLLTLLVKGAELTEDQRAQVRQIVEAHRSGIRGLVGQLRAAQAQLGERFLAPESLTAAELAPLLKQIAQLRAELGERYLQMALEVRAVLTPDQLARAAQTRQRLSELRGEMRTLLGAERQ